MAVIQKASRKELFGWSMFDFANSSFVTVIITVIFGPVFTTIIVPSSSDPNNPHAYGNLLWAVALAVARIITALAGPFVGAITDVTEKKKSFLFKSYIICIIATASLWFVKDQDWYILAFLLIIIAYIAFSFGENFIASFLPFLGPKKDLGEISGNAWALGYFGGLFAVMIIHFIVGAREPENYETLRFVGPLTALFFILCGIPTFSFLKEPKISTVTKQEQLSSMVYIKLGYNRLAQSLRQLQQFKDLSIFLLALFFTLASLHTIVSFTFIYGKQEIGLTGNEVIKVFVSTQVAAAIGAFIFGWVQDYWGSVKTFITTLVLWIACILLLYYIHETRTLINHIFGTNYGIVSIFLIFASIAGLGLGAVQSAGRTVIALFSPDYKSGENFGIWGLVSSLSAVLGLSSMAWLQYNFGLRNAFIILLVFFCLSLIICLFVNEDRGIKNAHKANQDHLG